MKVLFLLLTVYGFANEPICEVYNIDKERCEFFSEQNATLAKAWVEFYLED